MGFNLPEKILMHLKRFIVDKFSGRFYALTMTLMSGFNISYKYKDGKYFVSQGLQRHFFLKQRGGRYFNGLVACGLKLASSYGIEDIVINEFDLIVDVGANNGDLLLFLEKFPNSRYIGFEPSVAEFRLLEMNSQKKNVHNLVVSDNNGLVPFYTSTFGADSSIYQPVIVEGSILVKSIRLDEWFDQFSKIKILKIDAEGAEYEVIKGAEKIFNLIEYIAVDLGFEKGINQETTAPQVINLLMANNFEILKFTKRNCFLFQNKMYMKNKNEL